MYRRFYHVGEIPAALFFGFYRDISSFKLEIREVMRTLDNLCAVSTSLSLRSLRP
jgi:hypothetical protein